MLWNLAVLTVSIVSTVLCRTGQKGLSSYPEVLLQRALLEEVVLVAEGKAWRWRRNWARLGYSNVNWSRAMYVRAWRQMSRVLLSIRPHILRACRRGKEEAEKSRQEEEQT